MSDQNHPNLFQYVANEPSSAAFIGWLAAWADPMYKNIDPGLHKTAHSFLNSMVRKVNRGYANIAVETVSAERQVGKREILVRINDNLASQFAIIIRMDTQTSKQEEGLGIHKETIVYEDMPQRAIRIYVKTNYHPQRLSAFYHYENYMPDEFLQALRLGRSQTNNAIYQDFLAYLEHTEQLSRTYQSKDIGLTSIADVWDETDWRGFFMHLYTARNQLYKVTERMEEKWEEEPDENELPALSWFLKELPEKPYYFPYLHLERATLSFKIKLMRSGQNRRIAHDDAVGKLRSMATQFDFPLQYVAEISRGRYQTIAHWPGDYRALHDGKLDMAATLANLKKAQELLDAAFVD